MLIIEKNIFRTSSLFIRRLYSQTVSNTNDEEQVKQKEHSSRLYYSIEEDSPVTAQDTKCLKVAILGSPNAGKSTLINQLVNRSLCATSSKVHTTLCQAKAVYTQDNSQLVFIDTPGLVTSSEFKRYKLQSSFVKDPVESLMLADTIGIIQDASNLFTNFKINSVLLESLKQLKLEKPIFLVLNKVDLLKKKGILLSLVAQITKNEDHPKFSDIFMISALTGDGVNDLRNYLLAAAKPAKWLFNPTMYTDQAVETMIEQTVRSKYMDKLAHEVPYNLKIKVDHVEMNTDGGILASVRVICRTERCVYVAVGNKGEHVRAVAKESEEFLRNAFRAAVGIKLCVEREKKK